MIRYNDPLTNPRKDPLTNPPGNSQIDSRVWDLLALFSDYQIKAHLVGGAVRDSLAYKAQILPPYPITDYDVAVKALPTVIEAFCHEMSIPIQEKFLNYGCLKISYEGLSVDLTSLRYDHICKGRSAKVSFTPCMMEQGFKEDAKRRDFTFNAIYLDHQGNYDDPYGGITDLYQRQVRFIGDPMTRIQEDTLRLWRFVRFQALYGTHWPSDDLSSDATFTMTDLKAVWPLTYSLSIQRRQQEFFKILMTTNPLPTLEILRSFNDPFMKDVNLSHLNALSHILTTTPTACLMQRLAVLYPISPLPFHLTRQELRYLRDFLC